MVPLYGSFIGSVTSLVYVGKVRLLFSSSLDGQIFGWTSTMKISCEHKVCQNIYIYILEKKYKKTKKI